MSEIYELGENLCSYLDTINVNLMQLIRQQKISNSLRALQMQLQIDLDRETPVGDCIRITEDLRKAVEKVFREIK